MKERGKVLLERFHGEPACASPRRTSALGRQTNLLPGFHAAGEMGIVGQPRGLRHQRRGDGPVARAAGEYDLTALGVGNCSWIELRHRKIEGLGVALDFGLVRLETLPSASPRATSSG